MKNFTLKTLVASLMLLLGALTMQAADFEVDGIAYNITSSGVPYTVMVTYKGEYIYSGEKYSGSIFIPSSVTYDGITYSVTEIGFEAFYGCFGLTSIEIPESVTIGESAFMYCKSLTSITIPKSVTIGDYAFRGCESLTSIKIPESVTEIGRSAFSETPWYNNQEDGLVYAGKVAYRYKGTMPASTTIKLKDDTKGIAGSAFYECTGLTSIVIPEGVTKIGNSAFWYCTGLTSVVIPESVTKIGDYAFKGCTGLKSIEIPSSVTEIGEKAFWDCKYLTSIVIPESVTEIGAGAFDYTRWYNNQEDGLVYAGKVAYQYKGTMPASTTIKLKDDTKGIAGNAFSCCPGLTSIVIPSSVTKIGKCAFWGCSGLTSIEIPKGVTEIGLQAFKECTGLTSIVIPESVTKINYGAFWGCTGLTSIVIPESVTAICYYAFSGCTGLNSITCESANPPTFIGYDVFEDVDKSIPIYVPQKSIEEYKNADGWKEFTNIQCIKAEPVEEEIEETITEPQEKSVTITWPIAEGATSYKIVLTKDGETVCTITFSETGELLTIEYKTPTTKSAELRDATASVKGFRYEIKNLERWTQYSYTVTTYGASESVIREDSGAFTTLGGVSVSEQREDAVAELKASISILGRTIAVEGVEASDVKVYNPAGQRVSNPVPSAGVYVVAVGSSAVKVMVK